MNTNQSFAFKNLNLLFVFVLMMLLGLLIVTPNQVAAQETSIPFETETTELDETDRDEYEESYGTPQESGEAPGPPAPPQTVEPDETVDDDNEENISSEVSAVNPPASVPESSIAGYDSDGNDETSSSQSNESSSVDESTDEEMQSNNPPLSSNPNDEWLNNSFIRKASGQVESATQVPFSNNSLTSLISQPIYFALNILVDETAWLELSDRLSEQFSLNAPILSFSRLMGNFIAHFLTHLV